MPTRPPAHPRRGASACRIAPTARPLVAALAGALALASPAGAQEPGSASGPAADSVVEIGAEGSTLEFMPDRLTLQAGTTVTLRFVNGGTLPHNWVLLRSDDGLDEMAVAAYEATDSGYIPGGYDDDILAQIPLVSPDQTAEVTFTVPPAGEYTYVCLFPGHANMMLGTLRSRD